jgi:Flp pilus assembly pilin Flp
MTIQFLQVLGAIRYGDKDRGASLVEYALLISLIALVCLAAIAFFGTAASTSLSRSASKLG